MKCERSSTLGSLHPLEQTCHLLAFLREREHIAFWFCQHKRLADRASSSFSSSLRLQQQSLKHLRLDDRSRAALFFCQSQKLRQDALRFSVVSRRQLQASQDSILPLVVHPQRIRRRLLLKIPHPWLCRLE